MNEPRVKALNDAFVQTLSTNPAVIKQAEAQLQRFCREEGYAIAVLTVASLDSPVELRQAAAVYFKNFVKFHWAASTDDEVRISEAEKDQIKGQIMNLMLSTPPIVRAQLSEALAIIGEHDFPAKWPALLPQLLEKVTSGDLPTITGVLETANSIYKRYRNQMMSAELNKDLAYSQQLVQPLLQTLQKLVKQLESTPGSESALCTQLLHAIRLALRVFFSLNSPGLTEDFENTLDAWMSEFHKLLVHEIQNSGKGEAAVKAEQAHVKAAICQNINLLVSRDEEEFGKFLPTFVQAVWTQLVKVSNESSQDALAKGAIQFLTTVSRSTRNAQLFMSEDALRQICEKIVIPNLQFNDDMEAMFEMNYVEYVRRDTEGSDFDTRRRAATELVKALAGQFEAEVTQLFTGYVNNLFAEAASNPQAWKSKDVAIYLITALAVKGKTTALGATSTSQFVGVQETFERQVAPELRTGPTGQPVLQADALKYVTTLRAQLPKASLLAALPHIIALLRSESNVVHSYAAILLERLLTSKERGQPRFSVADLMPCIQALLENLFAVFALPDSAENEYVMKCIMRVISFFGPQITPVAPQCLEQLSKLLLAVCKNPNVPEFNHFLFESVAALIKSTAAAEPKTVATLEEVLFPPFQIVLAEDVQEFHPYVFQIFSQLIEVRPVPLPASYLELLRPLLTPVLWERPGNIPALVRLMSAYLSKATREIVEQNLLVGLLGVFQKLVAAKAHDHEGLQLLQSIVDDVPKETMDAYLPEVWKILFQRLQAAKTPKFVAGLLGFLSHFTIKRGPAAVQGSIDAIQPGLFGMLLEQVWLPTMGSVKAANQQNLLAVATTQLLCDCPALQKPEAAPLWGHLLQALLALLSHQSQGVENTAEDEDDEAGQSGYTAAFARLHHAARAESESVPDVRDPTRYLAESVARSSQAQPGRMAQLVQSHLAAEGQQQLHVYCQMHGVSIA